MSGKNLGNEDENVDFFYAHVSDYFGDNLGGAEREKFSALVKNKPYNAWLDKAKSALGKLQLSFQGYYLSEDQRVGLHEIVENAQVRKTRELEKIDQLGRKEIFSQVRRRLAIFFMLVALVIAVLYTFSRDESPSFNALETLAYEALAMEEDPEGKLDFPTANIDEVIQFFSANKSLGFAPVVLKNLVDKWTPEGATVIEYDASKVVSVVYNLNGQNEKLFYFVFKGGMGDFPKAEQGNKNGLIYQTYTSEQLNIIIWQQEKGVVGMLVGRRSAPELAGIAQAG